MLRQVSRKILADQVTFAKICPHKSKPTQENSNITLATYLIEGGGGGYRVSTYACSCTCHTNPRVARPCYVKSKRL